MEKETTRKAIESLIEDKEIPITYRNSFKRYLEWYDEKEKLGE